MQIIEVLDKGYVRLVKTTGTELDIVNAARVSFQKESDWDCVTQVGSPDLPSQVGTPYDVRTVSMIRVLKSADERLVRFLAREGHMSPFRHVFATFEVKAPLLVARQWWKYVVGSDHTMDAWNEASRRYVTMEPEYHFPEVWRSAPENKKQGSGEPVDPVIGEKTSRNLEYVTQLTMQYYEAALADGIAPEQARLFLPAYAMYTLWRWTGSLQSITFFLNQRLKDDAQWEIQQYAKAVKKLIEPEFPISIDALVVK